MNVFGIPLEFFIFGLTLAVIASFHRAAFLAALTGLVATVAYKLVVLGGVPGARWLLDLFGHEWPGLANLFLLLVGFAVLADHFEQSAIPDAIWRQTDDTLLSAVRDVPFALDALARALLVLWHAASNSEPVASRSST